MLTLLTALKSRHNTSVPYFALLLCVQPMDSTSQCYSQLLQFACKHEFVNQDLLQILKKLKPYPVHTEMCMQSIFCKGELFCEKQVRGLR